jgi:stage V sporulation protein G
MGEAESVPIPITRVQLTFLAGGGATKAVGSVTFGGSFVVHGIRVVESEKGMFVGMPQRKDGDGYRDLAHPITGELRARLGSAVLEEYQKLRDRDRER